jgi:transketolase
MPVLVDAPHVVTGGFGTAVGDTLAEAGTGTRLVKIGMPDQYSILDPPTHLYRHYKLDGEGLAGSILMPEKVFARYGLT